MTTFVLVPGAGGVPWQWHRVVPLLEAAGHEAIAVDLPGDDESAGLPEYVDLVAATVGDHEDVVLVAQSIGGFSATPVAASDAHPNVRALVYVNAMIPAPGETSGAWWGNVGSEAARVAAAEEGGWPVEFDLDTYFLHDLPADVIASGEHEQREETGAVFEAPCDFERLPDRLTIRVVMGAEDRFFPPALQSRVSQERLGVAPDLLPGGHLLILSRPEPLVDLLLNV